jgi:hypothetical protein
MTTVIIEIGRDLLAVQEALGFRPLPLRRKSGWVSSLVSKLASAP